jgi:hypothetical protein
MPAAEPAASQRKFLRVKALFPKEAGWAGGASRVLSVSVTFQVYGVAAPLHRGGAGWNLKREQEATAFSLSFGVYGAATPGVSFPQGKMLRKAG